MERNGSFNTKQFEIKTKFKEKIKKKPRFKGKEMGAQERHQRKKKVTQYF